MRSSLVRMVIMPWELMLFLGIATLFIAGIQFAVAYGISSNVAVEKKITCVVQSIHHGKEGWLMDFGETKPSMTVDCNGKQYPVRGSNQQQLIVFYLQRPQALVCSIYKNDQARCRLPKS